jgi:hypothetical protein
MLVGVNLPPANLATRLPRYPGAAVCRVFGAAGQGIPAWTDRRIHTLLAAGVIPHVSFKDWADDTHARAAVWAWLDGLPVPTVHGRDVAWLTYHHEPEGDLAAQEYRRRWFVLAEVLYAHPHGDAVRLVPIQTLQWTTNPAKGNGDPTIFYAGVGMPGMDCYADSWRATYPDPVRFVAPALRLAAASGGSLVVPELGAMRLVTDATGNGRADWIRAVCGLLIRGGCVAVSWWDTTDRKGKSFLLDDEPSYQAWRDVLAGRI